MLLSAVFSIRCEILLYPRGREASTEKQETKERTQQTEEVINGQELVDTFGKQEDKKDVID